MIVCAHDPGPLDNSRQFICRDGQARSDVRQALAIEASAIPKRKYSMPIFSRQDLARSLHRAQAVLRNPDMLDEQGRHSLCDELAIAEALLDAHMVPWTLEVHVATIDHRHGQEIYVALTDEALTAQIAAYGRLWWSEIDDPRDPAQLSDGIVSTTYFAGHETEDLSTELITIPGPEAPAPETIATDRCLTLSISHIRPSTGALLDEWAERVPDDRPLGIGDTGFGWFVRTSAVECSVVDPMPDELAAVLGFARRQGCRYLLIDRDGDELAELDCFDW